MLGLLCKVQIDHFFFLVPTNRTYKFNLKQHITILMYNRRHCSYNCAVPVEIKILSKVNL